MSPIVMIGIGPANVLCEQAVELYLAEHGEEYRPWVRCSVPRTTPRHEGNGWYVISILTNRAIERYHYVMWRPDDNAIMMGPERV